MASGDFKKSARLLKRAEFIAISKRGVSVSDRYFVAAYRSNMLDRTRLGITVSKKVGNAVVRNRIKRIVREHFRLNKHRIRGSRDINIIARKAAADLSSDRAYASLDALVSRIKGVD